MKATTITIKTPNGDREVEAFVCGRWAVHRPWNSPSRRWEITHVASGFCIGPFHTAHLTKVPAIDVARRLTAEFTDREERAFGTAIDGKATRTLKRLGVRVLAICAPRRNHKAQVAR